MPGVPALSLRISCLSTIDLAVRMAKGVQGQREVVSPETVLGRWGRGEQEEGNRTYGEKWFACCPSPMFLFSR